MPLVSDYYKLECENARLKEIIHKVEDLAGLLSMNTRTLKYTNKIMSVIHKDWQS